MASEDRRKGNNALGVLVLSLLVCFEAVLVDHKLPQPASPYVWAALGLTAMVALVQWVRYRARERASLRAQREGGEPP